MLHCWNVSTAPIEEYSHTSASYDNQLQPNYRYSQSPLFNSPIVSRAQVSQKVSSWKRSMTLMQAVILHHLAPLFWSFFMNVRVLMKFFSSFLSWEHTYCSCCHQLWFMSCTICTTSYLSCVEIRFFCTKMDTGHAVVIQSCYKKWAANFKFISHLAFMIWRNMNAGFHFWTRGSI